MRGDVLVLALEPGNGFHRGVLVAPELRDALAALFEKTLGSRLTVDTVERAREAAADAPADAARKPPERGERLTAAERAAAEQASLTRLLEKELKARIVHVERQD